MLLIAGERKQESVQEDKKVKRIERSYGSFERRFRLPPSVKEEDIKAKLSNGVLNVRRPEGTEALPCPRAAAQQAEEKRADDSVRLMSFPIVGIAGDRAEESAGRAQGEDHQDREQRREAGAADAHWRRQEA